jgi:hypothetical protein
MISSKVWSVIRDIENIYGFKFVLFGDFYQLPSVEANHYDIVIVKYLQKYAMVR